ncbi:MAG: hypothetical protein M3198_03425 [Actinomycetota bacterium]|nr:hypothetical protein [Actinomycetota bacterium]
MVGPQRVRGAVVPHAPLLLPAISGPEVAPAATTLRRAMGEIDLTGFDLVVVLSPHGRRTGVYPQAAGTLGDFGYSGIGLEMEGDAEVTAALASAWGSPLLDDGADHGIVVPFLLWNTEHERMSCPVVAASLAETSGDGAISFAEALLEVTGDRRVLFVASANGSAGLSARAPVTEIEGTAQLEDAFLDALRQDAAGVEKVVGELVEQAGSCGGGPLTALARLCAGQSSRILAHERPVGVGYTVAVTDG